MTGERDATALALHGDQCPASYLWVMISLEGKGEQNLETAGLFPSRKGERSPESRVSN